MSTFILWFILGLFLASSEAQELEKEREINETLKDLLIENLALTPENSYRCGIFFAGDELNDPPRFKIFIIPKRFKLDCGQPEEDAKIKAKDGCNELFEIITSRISLTTKSRKKETPATNTVGDDLCDILQNDAKMKRLPGPNHPKFKSGVPVGFYYSVCENTTWYDSELRGNEAICCKNRKLWKYTKCTV